MTDSQEPQEPEYIDAELVDDEEGQPRSDKPKLLGPFAGLNLIDDEQGRSFLTELKRMGVPISDEPLEASVITVAHEPTSAAQITASFDMASITTHGSQVEVLSELLYDIAKIAEAVNMSQVGRDAVPADEGYTVGERMEQIMEMIGTAPLTQQYATRLASGT